MKILVLSNLYPPHYIGGYELCCYDVVELLRAKGHEIKVLTSDYGAGRDEADSIVCRGLHAQFGWEKSGRMVRISRLIPTEIHNQRSLKEACADFRPDLIYVWNLSGFSLSLAFLAQQTGIPVVYYVLDEWLLRHFEQKRRRLLYHIGRRLLDLTLTAMNLRMPSGEIDFTSLVFVSHFLKNRYAQVVPKSADSKVIHLGINVERYIFRDQPSPPNRKRLLYVGQIVSHKGVHTALEALKILVQHGGYQDLNLTIAGGTVLPDYEAGLRTFIASSGIGDHVRFTGPISREAVADIYPKHDILIFPSIWDEPLGMVPLEAMASGLAVVGTGAGGSSEILRHDVNALTFLKGDASSCAFQLQRLLDNATLYDRLRREGRRMVKEYFGWDTMMRGIENALYEAVSGNNLQKNCKAATKFNVY